MLKLKNYTEDEILEIIDNVSSRYAQKYSFGYYEPDDIKQEAFILSLEALEKYDEVRPLENFLAVHIRNKLITFIRNNYYRTDYSSAVGEAVNDSKRKIMNMLDISLVNAENESRMTREFGLNEIYTEELMDILDYNLHPHFREDYHKYLDGFKLTSAREENLLNHLKEIADKYYANGW